MPTVRRLLDHFAPTHYDIAIDIKRAERTFSGTVTLTGEALTEEIFLHTKDLSIVNATIDGTDTLYEFGDDDEMSFRTSTGIHTITVGFEGTITDQMHGMYPCYFTHDDTPHELIATQFESHHAREVFPCIDEPEAKATFDVSLITETDITVLGNMPVTSQESTGSTMTTKFETSPRMSTYLVAWVCGTLQKKSARTTSGVEVNIWATPAQPAESLDFALDTATQVIDFYDDYFGVPYPLPKSDHVALPDFSSGAMENWGLVTYREVALLAHPTTTSVSARHYVATVIAHELAHQWFGNLVTMKWWNDLWLNESFATLMEYIAVDALEPSWNVWMDFASAESVIALRRDAMDGVQAVQVDVNHPDEISTLFDSAIVYAKGARLLRMLETYIGPGDFRAGLQAYFKSHAYKNTSADDLWNALSTSSGKDIAGFMNAWITQPGYPVVEVEADSISQTRFFIGTHEPSDSTWPIPPGINDTTVPELLQGKQIDVELPLDTRLNTTDSAHFITKYAPERTTAILQTIADATPLSRLQFMHEQSLLARGGFIESASLIPLLTTYTGETTESVWDIMALTFGELKRFVEPETGAEKKLKELALHMAKERFGALSWDEKPGEPESNTKLRAVILSMMLYSERPDVVDEAFRRFESTLLENLPSETRSLFISNMVRHRETKSLVDQLVQTYSSTSSVDLKGDITAGLTSTQSPETAAHLLALSMDQSVIKTQDAFRWFVYLVRNRYTRDTAWQWLQNNWDWVKATFGGDKSYDDYPRYAATGLSTRQQLSEYKAFFGPMSAEPALTRTIKLGTSEIEARISLLERDTDGVRAALQELTLS